MENSIKMFKLLAVDVLQIHQLNRPINTAQIIATVAGLFAVLAGITTQIPARLNANLNTLRRNFIISSIFSLIATVLLAVTLGFFSPRAWDLWRQANSTPGFASPDFSDPTQTGNQVFDTSFRVIFLFKLTKMIENRWNRKEGIWTYYRMSKENTN